MHELSLCQDLLGQLTELARVHGARSVARVNVQIGMLAGVEPLLLESAFTIARAGTVAERADFVSEVVSPEIYCAGCAAEFTVGPSSLRCPACGSEDTRLIRGDQLILARVELEVDDTPPPEQPFD